MSESTEDVAVAESPSAVWPFVKHYLWMLLSMAIGMALFTAPLRWLFGIFVGAAPLRPPVPNTLLMATSMSLGMALWMAWRRHSWISIVEMSAAMYVSFAVLYPPYWLGWLDGDALMGLGHLLMLPAMLLAMLWRRDEYTGHRH